MQRLKYLLLLALIVSANSFSDELGRLFYSAEQRALMNQQRSNPPKSTQAPIEKTQPSPIQLPDKIQFNGVFLSKNQPLIWLNQALSPWEGIKSVHYLAKKQAVSIRLNDDRVIKLQVGESWVKQEMASDTASDTASVK